MQQASKMLTKLIVPKLLVFYKTSSKKCLSTYSKVLEKTVLEKKWFCKIKEASIFEDQMVKFFNDRSWSAVNNRRSHLKQSFVYLLIDPRLSNNLPEESKLLPKHEVWKRFLSSIFYVGKGKNARPHAHLHEALSLHCLEVNGNREKPLKRFKKECCEKTSQILDIWKSGYGVVCLHVFHNILEVEALTREAAIIEALSLSHLTNNRSGTFYGPFKMWPISCKSGLGTLILWKALQVYLAEGESQLTPKDI